MSGGRISIGLLRGLPANQANGLFPYMPKIPGSFLRGPSIPDTSMHSQNGLICP